MTFLSFFVDSINIKGNIFSKINLLIKLFFSTCTYFFYSWLFFLPVISLVLFGGIETNPSPGLGCSNSFSFCHWNLNSIAAHNFIKMSLLQTYNFLHKSDIMCLLGTYYLDNSYHSDNDQLALPWYNLIRADNPNIKIRGVFIYYRGSLPVKIIIVNFLINV